MTIARACRPPAQAFCRWLVGRWWIAQHPPRTVVRNSLHASCPMENHLVIGRLADQEPVFHPPS